MANQATFPAALGVWGSAQTKQFSGQILREPDLWDVPGVSEQSAKPDYRPWTDPQRIRWAAKTRRVQFEIDDSPPLFIRSRAWMLAFWEVPDLQMGVIEKIATYTRVQALDPEGVPLATFVLDGTDPTLATLAHPIPAAGALSLSWRLTQAERTNEPPTTALNAVNANQVPGYDMRVPWTSDQLGWAQRWSDSQQMIVDAQTRLRLWLQIDTLNDGSAGSWRIQALGLLSGYAQMRGPRPDDQAALVDARRRS